MVTSWIGLARSAAWQAVLRGFVLAGVLVGLAFAVPAAADSFVILNARLVDGT